MKKEALAELKAELEERTAEINELRAAEIEIRNKLDENQKVLAENQKRSRYWQEKLSKLSLQSVGFVLLLRSTRIKVNETQSSRRGGYQR